MTKVQDLTRRNLAFGILAVSLVAVLVLRPAETSAVRTQDLPLLFSDLELEDARHVLLRRDPAQSTDGSPAAATESLRIARQDGDAWRIDSKGGYPAEATRIRAFLEALVAARLKKVVTERPEAFAEYAGPDGWTHVQVSDAVGNVLAEADVGKSAGWPDAFVRMVLDGQEKVVRVHNLGPERASLAVGDWAESRLWPGLTLEDVEQIDVFQTEEKQTLSFARKDAPESAGTDGADTTDAPDGWEMRAPRQADAETWRVENLIRTFSGLQLEDVLGQAEDAEAAAKYGLEKPSYRVTAHLRPASEGAESERRVLLVGRGEAPEDGAVRPWYVRREGDPWVFRVLPTALGDFRLPPDDFLPPPPADEEPAGADDAEERVPDEAEGDPDAVPADDPEPPPGEPAED